MTDSFGKTLEVDAPAPKPRVTAPQAVSLGATGMALKAVFEHLIPQWHLLGGMEKPDVAIVAFGAAAFVMALGAPLVGGLVARLESWRVLPVAVVLLTLPLGARADIVGPVPPPIQVCTTLYDYEIACRGRRLNPDWERASDCEGVPDHRPLWKVYRATPYPISTRVRVEKGLTKIDAQILAGQLRRSLVECNSLLSGP